MSVRGAASADLMRLSVDLNNSGRTITRRSRGAGAKAVDAVAAAAESLAQSTYGQYSTGATASTIRARMSSNRGVVEGYVFMEGGGFYQEFGTARHPAQPVLGPALDQAGGQWADQIADAGGDVL